MIYRIHHDERFLMHVIPPVESMTKLGEEHGTFAFNAAPKPYATVWKPLQIEFSPCSGSQASEIPDISENFGRLFLSAKAYEALSSLLNTCGEFLPVTFNDNENGYIFNPLVTAESLNAVDNALTTHDVHGNLEYFGFDQAAITDTTLFKTELDSFKAMFCSNAIKNACEENALTGISFHEDVSNPIGENYGITQ